MKNSTQKGMGAWGIGSFFLMPHAPSGEVSFYTHQGMSFPPLSMNARSLNSDLQHQNSSNWLQNHKKMQILCMLCD